MSSESRINAGWDVGGGHWLHAVWLGRQQLGEVFVAADAPQGGVVLQHDAVVHDAADASAGFALRVVTDDGGGGAEVVIHPGVVADLVGQRL